MESTDEDRRQPAAPTAYEARFIDTASALGDVLRVRIPGFDDGEHPYEVVWAPSGDELPQEGGRALVIESDQGAWWAITWTAAS